MKNLMKFYMEREQEVNKTIAGSVAKGFFFTHFSFENMKYVLKSKMRKLLFLVNEGFFSYEMNLLSEKSLLFLRKGSLFYLVEQPVFLLREGNLFLLHAHSKRTLLFNAVSCRQSLLMWEQWKELDQQFSGQRLGRILLVELVPAFQVYESFFSPLRVNGNQERESFGFRRNPQIFLRICEQGRLQKNSPLENGKSLEQAISIVSSHVEAAFQRQQAGLLQKLRDPSKCNA